MSRYSFYSPEIVTSKLAAYDRRDPISCIGVFLSLPVVLGGVGRERGNHILEMNVYHVALNPGGGGNYKSPPSTVQYSRPHVFQGSEVF